MSKDSGLIQGIDDDATRILSAEESELLKQASLAAASLPPSAPIAPDPSQGVALAALTPLTAFTATQKLSKLEVAEVQAQPAPSKATESSAQGSNLLQPGAKVAEFEIVRLIGQGGFGVVYEAWDHALERVVAIKEYMPASLASRQSDGMVLPHSEGHKETFEAGMRSFINEAKLLAQFDHPALLKVYRYWQEFGTTYMVMPLYKGETLKQALIRKKGQVDQAWLMGVIDGVTQALAVMHSADCYHRDVAPDNIMLLEDTGLPVVLDFGAARRVITDMTQALTVILKPGYAPIEQYSETPDMKQGAWTDVYALSAVMYCAVTGRPPPPSVARMIQDRCAPLAGDTVLQATFSPQLLAAIDAGLAVLPDKRIQSMASLRAALGLGALSSTMSSFHASTQSSKMMSAQMQAKPNPNPRMGLPLWIMGGVAGLVAVSVLAWWLLAGSASPPVTAAIPPKISNAAPAATPAPPPQVASAPVSPLDSMTRLLQSANSKHVTATTAQPTVQIGKDKLSFQVQSSKAGFVYVYLLSSASDLFLLFPNALDKRNRISAGETLNLPRASWAMDAGGPAGDNKFVALVSDHEIDLTESGVRVDGVFAQFPPNVLAALEASRPTGASPLLGKPICEGIPVGGTCVHSYSATSFKITEK
jgi:serine/threonine protein kinase